MSERKKKGLIMLVVILVLALIMTTGYIVYDKFIAGGEVEEKNDDNKVNTIKEDISEQLVDVDVNSTEIQDLFSNISHGLNSYCGINYYYQDKKIFAGDLSNDLVFDIVLSQLYNDRKAQGELYPFSQIGYGFTVNELDEKLQVLLEKIILLHIVLLTLVLYLNMIVLIKNMLLILLLDVVELVVP